MAHHFLEALVELLLALLGFLGGCRAGRVQILRAVAAALDAREKALETRLKVAVAHVDWLTGRRIAAHGHLDRLHGVLEHINPRTIVSTVKGQREKVKKGERENTHKSTPKAQK